MQQNIFRQIQRISKNDTIIKTLGLSYVPLLDQFKMLSPKVEPNSLLTKRQEVGFISKFYDPLGLIGPILVKSKLFIQK